MKIYREHVQGNLIKANEFFCGILFLAGVNDQIKIALIAWDKPLYADRLFG